MREWLRSGCWLALLSLMLASTAALAENFTPIDVPGGTGTRAFGINNLGQVVGRYDDANGIAQGFLRRANGRYVTISAPGGVNGTWAPGHR